MESVRASAYDRPIPTGQFVREPHSFYEDCNTVVCFPCYSFQSEIHNRKGICSSVVDAFICRPEQYTSGCCCCFPGEILLGYFCFVATCCSTCLCSSVKDASDPTRGKYLTCFQLMPPICSFACASCVCVPLLFFIPVCGDTCICDKLYECKSNTLERRQSAVTGESATADGDT